MKAWRVVPLAGVIGAAMLMASCGQPGAPQPPSLELPKAVNDLSATRKGDRVTLRWLPPDRFTDGRIIRRLGPTNICRAEGQTIAATCTSVGTSPAPPNLSKHEKPQRNPVEYQDTLPKSLLQNSPTGNVMYGIEVLNVHGRSAGISNQVEISTAPALAPPGGITASISDRGVTLNWQVSVPAAVPGLSFVYQVSRRTEDGDFAEIATVPVGESSYLDQTVEWEKKFAYRMAVLTEAAGDKKVLVAGDDSEPVSGFAHDVFPPAQPREVQAVFSGPGQQPFIDLSWAPNLEPDLAGYNVFRREEGGEPAKINPQLVTSPSFRDEHVESGKKYFYSVSAVDARGNQSSRSPETSESVP